MVVFSAGFFLLFVTVNGQYAPERIIARPVGVGEILGPAGPHIRGSSITQDVHLEGPRIGHRPAVSPGLLTRRHERVDGISVVGGGILPPISMHDADILPVTGRRIGTRRDMLRGGVRPVGGQHGIPGAGRSSVTEVHVDGLRGTGRRWSPQEALRMTERRIGVRPGITHGGVGIRGSMGHVHTHVPGGSRLVTNRQMERTGGRDRDWRRGQTLHLEQSHLGRGTTRVTGTDPLVRTLGIRSDGLLSRLPGGDMTMIGGIDRRGRDGGERRWRDGGRDGGSRRWGDRGERRRGDRGDRRGRRGRGRGRRMFRD